MDGTTLLKELFLKGKTIYQKKTKDQRVYAEEDHIGLDYQKHKSDATENGQTNILMQHLHVRG